MQGLRASASSLALPSLALRLSPRDAAPARRASAARPCASAVGDHRPAPEAPAAAPLDTASPAAAASAETAPAPAALQAVEEEDFEEDLLLPAERPVVAAVAAAVNQPVVKAVLLSGAAVLGLTFAFSAYKVWLRFSSARAQRRRTVGKNASVVEALAAYLPANRAALTPSVVRKLAAKTGFAAPAIFRKQLRYIINERPFDGEALADILALRAACALGDGDVEAALAETAARTAKKTGILMRRPAGLTAEGLARKALGRATFSKLLYLAEQAALLPEAAQPRCTASLRAAFGATSEDEAALRLPGLLDSEALERVWAAADSDGGAGPEAEGEAPAAA